MHKGPPQTLKLSTGRTIATAISMRTIFPLAICRCTVRPVVGITVIVIRTDNGFWEEYLWLH